MENYLDIFQEPMQMDEPRGNERELWETLSCTTQSWVRVIKSSRYGE